MYEPFKIFQWKVQEIRALQNAVMKNYGKFDLRTLDLNETEISRKKTHAGHHNRETCIICSYRTFTSIEAPGHATFITYPCNEQERM